MTITYFYFSWTKIKIAQNKNKKYTNCAAKKGEIMRKKENGEIGSLEKEQSEK